MRVLLTLLGLVAAVTCYDAAYENVDVDKIIADDALLTRYMNCMLDKGPCDLELSAEFKKILPEIVQTACEKCTPKQKNIIRKLVSTTQEKKPEEFLAFHEKLDPKGEYQEKFAAFLLEKE
uniref:Putative chemosensory protein 12 n=1 Tax=Conopomorpha sinensis TaxID=940481 RepID=A0A649ZUD9_9NEOP|nr:putative chemosensory protein 12 [Conopomorpha sinensis]WGJ79144.1 chemosensory protein 5 [Conopomorpha sinensis]